MFRHGADWMVISDDRILEIMLAEGTGASSKLAQQDGIFVGRSNISKRLIKLSDSGLLEKLGNGVYALTTEGIGYTYGCYDAQTGDWISLSDPRATYKPSQQVDGDWNHVPEYADMYRSRIDNVELKARKVEVTSAVTDNHNTSNIPQIDTGDKNISQETAEKLLRFVSQHQSHGEYEQEDTIKLSQLIPDEMPQASMQELVNEIGLEAAFEVFPEYDFTEIDIPRDDR